MNYSFTKGFITGSAIAYSIALMVIFLLVQTTQPLKEKDLINVAVLCQVNEGVAEMTMTDFTCKNGATFKFKDLE